MAKPWRSSLATLCLTRAFEMMVLRTPEVPAERLLKVVGELWWQGLPAWWGGSVVDLESEGKEVDLETLEYIHLHKTGALLSACVITGALIGGADETLIAALRTYARGIGLAFRSLTTFSTSRPAARCWARPPART